MLGGFQYQGTRSDDPNDIVPHQHRRELRALRVFGAWTNLTDMKAGNTLDTLVTEDGRGVVRHYLQDVGSTFGVGANGPHEWNEGWEFLYDGPPSRRRLLTSGSPSAPGRRPTTRTSLPSAGSRATLRSRDVEASRAHGRLLRDARRRRVLGGAAGDGVLRRAIRAVVETGHTAIRRPAAPGRRPDQAPRKIGRAYLTSVNPIVDPALDARGR